MLANQTAGVAAEPKGETQAVDDGVVVVIPAYNEGAGIGGGGYHGYGYRCGLAALLLPWSVVVYLLNRPGHLSV